MGKRQLSQHLQEDEPEFPEIKLGSDSDELASDVEEEFEDFEEKRVRVLRKKALPAIEADYASDSSDEETYNTIGNVPLEWYDDYPHIGYDVSGKKIMRPAQGDDLDKFLASMDDPNAWRSVHDKLHGTDIVLSKQELEMLKRIQNHQFPDSQYDPYEVVPGGSRPAHHRMVLRHP
ncbi:Ribosome biogenesis protein erb1 [Kappamyces sp. JEL0680]|nr:Ribosome biogenesis protein erb1 [Kappamyces sp. JEL0680]